MRLVKELNFHDHDHVWTCDDVQSLIAEHVELTRSRALVLEVWADTEKTLKTFFYNQFSSA